jgi:RNA polymerase-binding transcription factor DksA
MPFVVDPLPSFSRVQQIREPGRTSNDPAHPAEDDIEGISSGAHTQHPLNDQLQAVHVAFERMEDGTFNIFARCNQAIPKDRLDSIPYAPYCIDCERAVEEREEA